MLLAAIAVGLLLGERQVPDRNGIPPRPNPEVSGALVRQDLLASPWYVLSVDFATQQQLMGFRFSTGLLSGAVTRDTNINLAKLNPPVKWSGALPFATGPVAGTVLYAYFDGSVSKLRVVAVQQGDDRLVLETDEVIHQAVLDPAGDAFYCLSLDPTTRSEIGIFRGSLASGKVERIVPPRVTFEATQIASQLFTTPDGSRLVSYDCRDDDCRLRAYMAPSGEPVLDVAAPGSGVYGITDTEVVLSSVAASLGPWCRRLPCPAIAFDLASGGQRRFGTVCSAATIVVLTDRSTLVTEAERGPVCGQSPYRIEAIDIASGQVVSEIPFPDSTRQLVTNSGQQAIGLPTGWFLMGSAGRLYALETAAMETTLTLMRLDDGFSVDLPVVSLEHS